MSRVSLRLSQKELSDLTRRLLCPMKLGESAVFYCDQGYIWLGREVFKTPFVNPEMPRVEYEADVVSISSDGRSDMTKKIAHQGAGKRLALLLSPDPERRTETPPTSGCDPAVLVHRCAGG